MTYFCKKCGAVVTGKFCSCCGTMATTDLADYRNMMRRNRRRFVNLREKADGLANAAVAGLAWDMAEKRVLDERNFRVDTFPQIASDVYSKIPEMEKKAAKFYEVITATADIIFSKEVAT